MVGGLSTSKWRKKQLEYEADVCCTHTLLTTVAARMGKQHPDLNLLVACGCRDKPRHSRHVHHTLSSSHVKNIMHNKDMQGHQQSSEFQYNLLWNLIRISPKEEQRAPLLCLVFWGFCLLLLDGKKKSHN